MNRFRPTILATMVASAMTAGLGSVAMASPQQGVFFDATSQSSKVSIAFSSQKQLAEQPTRSGAKSQFDAQLGKATFVWGGVEQAKPDMALIAPEQQSQYAAGYYLNALTGMSTSKNATVKAELANLHDTNRGAIVAKYKQTVHDIEVFNREYNVMMDREYNLVAGSGYFADGLSNKQSFALLANFQSPEQAIEKAFKELGNVDVSLVKSKDASGYVVYHAESSDASKEVIGQPRAKKVFFELKGELVAAYYVEVQLADKGSLESDYHSYVIEASSGKVLFRKDLQSHAADFHYRVYADQDGYPWEGPHGNVLPAESANQVDKTEILDAPMVSLTHYGRISTQDPWLADDATITSGNNVFAYADVVAPQGFTEGDFTAEVTSNNTFDYQLKGEEGASSFNNRKAAIVNMFFMNNFLHDFFYDHGFDEAAGNAQLSNYGRGGVEGDPLEVQAQDYSGLNNANMSTPADGASPRMQQYLYTSKDAVVGENFGAVVTSHDSIGLLLSSQVASFGPQQYSDVAGEVAVIDDGTGTVTDGCEPAVNGDDLAGKIVMIDRGGCTFASKVLNAQNAGATGVLVVNNANNGTPAPMGGSDSRVTIPSIGLNYEEGHSIYDLLGAGDTVTVEMFNDFALKDSSFDNGIIAHEWGHYISNRLVGNSSGLINFQGRAMGEGWGDFHSLMFIVKEEDINLDGNDMFQRPYATGTYVEDFYRGIRRLPYTTDMSINGLSFRHITEGAGGDIGIPGTSVASPHAAGEIWATMLWESYVALINEHGFSEAQKRMADYLIAGYKLTPIAPTYTEARDAILAAAYANSTSDYALILGAFAKRGMGLGAVSPARYSTNLQGVVESDKTQLATYQVADFSINETYDGVELGFCSNDGILDKGETGTVSVTIRNVGSEMLSGVQGQLVVTSGHDVTFENDGLITFGDMAPFQNAASGAIKMTLNDADTADELVIEVQFPELAENDEIVEASSLAIATTVNMDFEDRAPVGGKATDDMESVSLFNDWRENVMFGGDMAEGTLDVDNGGNVGFFASFGYDLGEQTLFLNNNGFQSDVAIETKPFQIGYGGNFEVSFWHFYGIEEDYDGGVVEIRINDGEWVDVTEMGGVFDVGYVGELIESTSQALQNRPTFTGRNPWGNMERINFGSALNGNRAQLRFRIATDTNATDFGWWIDNVTFSNVLTSVFSDVVAGDSFACDNSAPKLTVPASLSMTEGQAGTITAVATDRNAGDSLTYSWTQVSGPAATLSNANTATLSITPPSITANSQLVFQVTVSDGKESVSANSTVNLQNVTPPVVSDEGSSGGSMGWLSLLLLPLTWLRRRKTA
ncbi:rhombosortase-dependent M36 family metallopeptidase [Aliiglaciecola sp. CAU 1673]|uniref:rhombosortase-dependent M36 family metallopeptidase n=1 Tax=Aliiglaciecola sp. CAU 1673 TaxID=3032595 RepID=UPI0023DB9972|nr:rhombosortase-dependent M36 family metallopeptidase [Aliiglaciecola sp. CAU 1673]MDF2177551.1 rhombosortase-dependent M36 family metallopeptidase [Aliiglaciecola sp. CAU 1673]